MSWWTVGLAALVALSALGALCWVFSWWAHSRRFRRKVGLDLAGLVALLPPDLQSRRYTGFLVALWSHDHIRVGLIYADGDMRRGNPQNVGLVFDRETGALVEICPDGFGLGLK